MIVTCPSCAARYRLSESALARPARLKCAACGHRWMPVAEAEAPPPPTPPPPPPPRAPLSEADEDAAMRAVQEQIRARWQDAATPVAPPPGDITEELEAPPPTETFIEPSDTAPPPPSTWLRNLVAVIAGTALAIAAAGLWLGRQDPTTIPLLGETMARIAPPLPVELTVTGTTSGLSSGSQVLEVTGAIINRGTGVVAVPALEAVLAGPDGVALRWTIPPPRRTLGPNQQVAYTSTVTGFPASATKLQVRAAE